jgi:glycopeptide antibiotics resistance protein
MNTDSLVWYVGTALLYTALAMLGLAAASRLTGLWSMTRILPTAFPILFFVVLTQHPFPDPATLQCPFPYTTPQLVPFDVVQRVLIQWSQEESALGWLLRISQLSVIMNVVLCAVIGAMLARHQMRLRTAVLLGFCLSLTVELTQLTGIWGIYPCAYRKFDVDDLILNTSGVAIGVAVARLLGWLRSAKV